MEEKNIESFVDIVMVTFNRLDFTKQAIDSIYKRTKRPFRLLVVDNGSTDGSKEWLFKKSKEINSQSVLTSVSPMVYIDLEGNYGLEAARNIGFDYVKTPYFVTVDNDCIAPDITPDWLTQLVGLLNTYKEYAAIALRPQVLVGVGTIFKSEEEVVENNVVGGSYRIMRAEAIKSVGGWTSKFENNGRGNEEHDICGKLKGKGWKVGYARNLWTYHLFGQEGTWGYDKYSNYRMGRVMEKSPQDVEYDPITCEPKTHSNE